MTLREVGDLTGINDGMLSRIERGERRLRPATRVKMARLLGVRVADLFEPEAPLDAAA
jgi:transcriptional regulator with XRE-family HTH domain